MSAMVAPRRARGPVSAPVGGDKFDPPRRGPRQRRDVSMQERFESGRRRARAFTTASRIGALVLAGAFAACGNDPGGGSGSAGGAANAVGGTNGAGAGVTSGGAAGTGGSSSLSGGAPTS